MNGHERMHWRTLAIFQLERRVRLTEQHSRDVQHALNEGGLLDSEERACVAALNTNQRTLEELHERIREEAADGAHYRVKGCAAGFAVMDGRHCVTIRDARPDAEAAALSLATEVARQWRAFKLAEKLGGA